jgi:hypothetical protein
VLLLARSRQRTDKEGLVQRTKLFLLLVSGLSSLPLLGAAPASSAPDPSTNKNAISVDLDCGGDSVVATGILQSASPTFLVVSSESPAIKAGSAGPTFG